MEYRSRTFRIDDEVWEAVQKHELSANKLLRITLGLDRSEVTIDTVEQRRIYFSGSDDAKVATRGIRPKGDTKR